MAEVFQTDACRHLIDLSATTTSLNSLQSDEYKNTLQYIAASKPPKGGFLMIIPNNQEVEYYQMVASSQQKHTRGCLMSPFPTATDCYLNKPTQFALRGPMTFLNTSLLICLHKMLLRLNHSFPQKPSAQTNTFKNHVVEIYNIAFRFLSPSLLLLLCTSTHHLSIKQCGRILYFWHFLLMKFRFL